MPSYRTLKAIQDHYIGKRDIPDFAAYLAALEKHYVNMDNLRRKHVETIERYKKLNSALNKRIRILNKHLAP